MHGDYNHGGDYSHGEAWSEQWKRAVEEHERKHKAKTFDWGKVALIVFLLVVFLVSFFVGRSEARAGDAPAYQVSSPQKREAGAAVPSWQVSMVETPQPTPPATPAVQPAVDPAQPIIVPGTWIIGPDGRRYFQPQTPLPPVVQAVPQQPPFTRDTWYNGGALVPGADCPPTG